MSPAEVGVTKVERAAVMVASANADFRNLILKTLESRSWIAEEALGGAEALAKLDASACRALLLDRWLPDLDVQELVSIVKARHPHLEVLVVDSEGKEPRIVEDLSSYHQECELFHILQNSREPRLPADKLAAAPVPFRARLVGSQPEGSLPGMIGVSEAMKQVYRLARLVVPRDTTVLLMGETGTGKELVAQAIHQLSPRSDHPFVIVNCAAIPETLLESELFGHTRGAFTGAFQSRLGRIHAAHGGTLLLDEVGDLPLNMQAKLLRFLQEGEVQRLGSADVFRVDVRVIAATNADLSRRVADGQFREDLYYRISVFPIELLPLRDHPQDIRPLAIHFLETFCREARVPPKSVSPKVVRMLENHPWYGNVRELHHVIERAFILAEKEPLLLPEYFSLQPPRQLSQRNLEFGA
jgi:DNA-binding NtrC family response regulator